MFRSSCKVIAFSLIVGVAAVSMVSAQIPSPSAGRASVHIPEFVSAGTWDGTWFHVSRDFRVALWMRSTDGSPELRLQFLRLGRVEQFKTDWTGSAHYDLDGAPGQFSLALTEGDDDLISAKWHWDLQFADSGRTETADLTIYRTGDGRQLVFLFEDFTIELRRGTHVQRGSSKKTWTFRKVSKRHVLWDELPF